eukprot:7488615-Pyramimonas_sp.AAC.1
MEADAKFMQTARSQGAQRSTWQCADPCRASRTTNGGWRIAVGCASDLFRRGVRCIPIGIDAGGSDGEGPTGRGRSYQENPEAGGPTDQ